MVDVKNEVTLFVQIKTHISDITVKAKARCRMLYKVCHYLYLRAGDPY